MLTNIEHPLFDKETINHIHHYNKNFLDTQKLSTITLYCLINHIKYNRLSVSFYVGENTNKRNIITFKAESAEVLCRLISLHKKITGILSTSHALYIGLELMKAELTMVTGQSYTQN